MNNPIITKFWFTAMAGPGSLEDLKELWEPIKQFFSGLVVTYHGEREDQEALYLESVKGEGKVVYLPYSRRHDFSRNTYLYCGPMQNGDWVIQADVLERIMPTFIENFVIPYVSQLRANSPNLLIYHTKVILYEYHESLRFQGSPHEGLRRDDGLMRGADITTVFPNEDDVRPNVRAKRRTNPLHWVEHYAKYWTFPWGSNHCLLGWEKRSPQELNERESRRMAFRLLLRQRGFPVTVDGIKQMFASPLDDEVKSHINGEIILNNLYRYYIQGEREGLDAHDPAKIVPIV